MAILSGIAQGIGATLSGIKAASPLRGYNIIPGDVSKMLSGITSQNWNRAMGYIPTPNPAYAAESYTPVDTVKAQKLVAPTYQTPFDPKAYEELQAKQQQAVASGQSGGYQQVAAPTSPYEGMVGDEEMAKEQQLDIINQEFSGYLDYLGQQEAGAQTEYQRGVEAVRGIYAPARETIKSQAELTKQGLETEATRTKQQSQKDVTRTRQRLSDLQRRQASYLSASGGYSSPSVTAALAEQFGRTAQQSLGDIDERRALALEDIANKKHAADVYVTNKLAEIDAKEQNALLELENQRDRTLQSVAQSRTMAESAKAQAVFDAWRDFYDRKQAINFEAANWRNSIGEWAQGAEVEAQSAIEQLQSAFVPEDRYTTQDTAMQGPVPGVVAQGKGGLAYSPVRFSGETEDEFTKRLYPLSQREKVSAGLANQGIASKASALLSSRLS